MEKKVGSAAVSATVDPIGISTIAGGGRCPFRVRDTLSLRGGALLSFLVDGGARLGSPAG